MHTSTRRSSRNRLQATERGASRRARARPEGTNRKVFVDSSAWTAFFSASDGRHEEADASFRRIYEERHPLVTTNLVLAETHQVLLRRAGIRPARLALDRIRSIAFLRLSFPARDTDVAAGQWLDRLADK